jgi:hypothetical protein
VLLEDPPLPLRGGPEIRHLCAPPPPSQYSVGSPPPGAEACIRDGDYSSSSCLGAKSGGGERRGWWGKKERTATVRRRRLGLLFSARCEPAQPKCQMRVGGDPEGNSRRIQSTSPFRSSSFSVLVSRAVLNRPTERVVSYRRRVGAAAERRGSRKWGTTSV